MPRKLACGQACACAKEKQTLAEADFYLHGIAVAEDGCQSSKAGASGSTTTSPQPLGERAG